MSIEKGGPSMEDMGLKPESVENTSKETEFIVFPEQALNLYNGMLERLPQLKSGLNQEQQEKFSKSLEFLQEELAERAQYFEDERLKMLKGWTTKIRLLPPQVNELSQLTEIFNNFYSGQLYVGAKNLGEFRRTMKEAEKMREQDVKKGFSKLIEDEFLKHEK